MKNIAIFASGSGSNAEMIMRHFQNHADVKVKLIVSNRQDAFVLQRAKKFQIKIHSLPKSWQKTPDELIALLKQDSIDLIVLAGFMQLIPAALVQEFKDRIVNIHPALLPKYGGKGMYGIRVHKAVKEASEEKTGITIHQVNEKYDEGKIIFQSETSISPQDSIESIQKKVQQLEHFYFPLVIEQYLKSLDDLQNQDLPFQSDSFPEFSA